MKEPTPDLTLLLPSVFFFPKVGLSLQIKHPEGGMMNLTIAEMKEDTITMDGNHPLAGKILTFDVELVDIT